MRLKPVFGAVVVCAALVSGCDKKEKESPVTVAPPAQSLAPSQAAPTSMVVKLKIEPGGTTSIDMPAPKERIKATTTVAAGLLEVDLMDLTQTRGEVKADLTSLKTSTFGVATKDASQTMHALTWLEVGDPEKGKLADDLKASHRFAVFAIRSIDGVATKDLAKIPPTSVNGVDVRSVDLVAHGELLIHGHKAKKDIPLTVKISHPAGALASAKPKSISIVTKAPLVVTLAEHDVRPRDDAGKIAKAAFSLIGTKVAETATISMDFTAVPAE